jgi:hypothetical protein
MMSGARKQFDVNRLMADLSVLKVELLSAQCATDRIRLQYSPEDIVAFGEAQALKRMIGSAEAMYRFFSEIAARIKPQERTEPAQ